MRYFLRDENGAVIGHKDGPIFSHVVNGLTYQFGLCEGVTTELSSGWKVPGGIVRLLGSPRSVKAKFAERVRAGAKLAAKHPILPPLPRKPTL